VTCKSGIIYFTAYLCSTPLGPHWTVVRPAAFVTQGLKTCRLSLYLEIELEAQIGERGFRFCNCSIQLVSMNLSQVE